MQLAATLQHAKFQESAAAASPAKSTPMAAPTPKASASDVAAAKNGGQVWVNTETGIYHKGGRWYGKTKKGKFLSEDDAKKAGYRAAEKE